MFWVIMSFFAVISIIRNHRQHGRLMTFDIIQTTMSGYFGLLSLGIELLIVFAWHVVLYPLTAFPSSILPVHISTMLLVLKKTKDQAPLTIMSYLIIAIAFQLKVHSYTMESRARTFNNYIFHLVSPYIVYKENPPRTREINYRALWEKVTGTVFCWLLAHLILEHYMLPKLKLIRTVSLPDLVLDIFPSIVLPTIFAYIVLFLLMFEFWLGALAEALKLEERQFFSDWWNSSSFDEFSRKWNIPIHLFIKKHVYKVMLERFKWTRGSSYFTCFVISAMLHEFVMWAALGQRLRHPPVIFVFQMLQIPLTWLATVISRCSPHLANMFFWFGMIFGPPLITVLYIRL